MRLRWLVLAVVAVVFGHDGLMAADVHAALDEGAAATKTAPGRHLGHAADHGAARHHHPHVDRPAGGRDGVVVPAPGPLGHLLTSSLPPAPECAATRSAAPSTRPGLDGDGDVAAGPPTPPPVLAAAPLVGPGPTAPPGVRRALLQVYRI